MAGLTPPRPLAAGDDRDGFDCGWESLKLWLRRHAWRNQESGVTRTSIVCDAETGELAGYGSLRAAQIERGFLAKRDQRNRPDPIPALLLGKLAVDSRYQGQGVARSLMFFALGTAVRMSQMIGCLCVLTHPLDDGVRAFYQRFGFEDLPYDPTRSMAVRIKGLVHNGFTC